ncbi:CaiB/BaiF CoA transferase family protein [Rhodovibrionaceae bacterium A322]
MLSGVRVVDLSQWLPGPAAGQMLADLGAEVVKVEPPQGDPMRRIGQLDPDGICIWYKLVNAGKSVVRLDLKTPEGQADFAALLAGADVLLESFRPGTLDKLTFTKQRLADINPKLVHCALSGFGQTGPYALKGGHDNNYLALGGNAALSGSAARPELVYPPVGDHASSMQAVIGILAALFRKERQGIGAYLDLSIMETVLAWQAIALTSEVRDGGEAKRGEGLLTGGVAFYRIYETADGRFVSLGAIEPKFWAAFCEAAGRPDWIARQAEPLPQKDLIAEVDMLFRSKTLDQWNALLETVDCCYEPLLEAEEMLAHPHLKARGQIVAHAADPASGRGAFVETLFGGWIDGEAPKKRPAFQEEEISAVKSRWG